MVREGQETRPTLAETEGPVPVPATTFVAASPSAESEIRVGEQAADSPVHLEEKTAEPQPEAFEKTEIDADLATTLGRPKVSVKPTGNLAELLKGKSMLAIDEDLTEEEEERLIDTSGLVGEYDEAGVRAAWQALVEKQKSKNKMGLAATLATGEWLFQDPTIRLTVANQVQFDELKEYATDLLHFVRLKVGNGGIALEVEVAEVEAAVQFLTPKDRYFRWAEEHPALETLRSRLDLDLS